jgi:hypothetical protein
VKKRAAPRKNPTLSKFIDDEEREDLNPSTKTLKLAVAQLKAFKNGKNSSHEALSGGPIAGAGEFSSERSY